MNGTTFVGWVRVWDIARITHRMSETIPVQGKVAAITRQYTHGGNKCYEGRVEVF